MKLRGLKRILAEAGIGIAMVMCALSNAYTAEGNVSQRGVDAVKRFEGYRTERYDDIAGNRTIGYGHLIRKGENYGKINEKKAEELLREDLKSAENAVRKYVKTDINKNQFDALVSFVYNVGTGNFKGSTLLKKVNSKDFEGAAGEFAKWNKAGGKVIAGLVKRRAEEKEMFEGK